LSNLIKKTTYTLKSGLGTLAIASKIVDANAPTFIFLHDSLGCITLWRDFPERVAKATNCNYLIYDRLGYGASSPNTNFSNRGTDYLDKGADSLIELIRALSIYQPILFGHSDGGSIALIAAAKAPTLIHGVISQAGHIFVEEITLAGIRAAKERYQTTDFRERLFKYHDSKVDGVFWAWIDIWLSEAFRNWNILPLIPKITTPVLIIQGEQDEYGTLKQVEEVVNNVSGYSQFLIIPDTGHAPHKEFPELIIEKIKDFINENC